jgi:hypothetical protein
MSVIEWTIGGGSVMFILGLVSAISSRRRKIKQPSKEHANIEAGMVPIEHIRVVVDRKNEEPKTAMSMAAAGTGNVSVSAFNRNAEENLASIGSHSR